MADETSSEYGTSKCDCNSELHKDDEDEVCGRTMKAFKQKNIGGATASDKKALSTLCGPCRQRATCRRSKLQSKQDERTNSATQRPQGGSAISLEPYDGSQTEQNDRSQIEQSAITNRAERWIADRD
ncbi:hypothetical protein P7C73_g188, partial [Tremellales sp. Uapishka_1]